MTPADTQDFFDAWDQCAELYGKSVSDDAKQLAFKLLAKYPVNQIKSALQAHMTDPDGGRFMPKPADVVGKIQIVSPSGYVGAEQAWAQFPRNEADSACICEEMAKAWGIACELDQISGRMAFKEAYEREVAQSKARGRVPVWYITRGSDKQQSEQVVLDSVRSQLISPKAAQVYLPYVPADELIKLSNQQVTVNALIENHAQTVTDVGQLLLSNDSIADKETALAHLAEMKKVLGA